MTENYVTYDLRVLAEIEVLLDLFQHLSDRRASLHIETHSRFKPGECAWDGHTFYLSPGDHLGYAMFSELAAEPKETTLVQKACSYPQLHFSNAKGEF